ncbi:LytR family transcriptional regulator [Actinotalea fermentans ATCC 43279 = JCM 9966 = DSM 3133]|nr:LytR family transcriptional regulator [Actinotalea fermentans ATCC 43279 = JCM 9966 = DSM 3133]
MRAPWLRRALSTLVALTVLAGCTGAPPAPTRSPSPSAAAPSPTPSPAPTPSPTAPPEPVDPLPDGPVNVLLIGTDSREATDLTGNADTIMLVHVPADRSNVYLVSLTRDMWVPIPGLGEGKINAAFSRGGTETLSRTVSDILGGVEIDYAIQSNFAGFIALTRALDGFEVENKHASTVTVQSTGRVVTFPQGPVTLSSTDGLIYVRERKRLPLGDLDRTERQRAAIIGMLDRIADRADEPAVLAELIPMLVRNVKITGDLDVDDAFALVPLAATLEREDVVGLMVPITGFGNRGGASVNLVDAPQTAALGEALRTDTVDAYVATYGTEYSPTGSS